MPTKTEGGQQYPAAAFAYVPDPQKPSSWKLRLWETPSGGPTATQVGRAVAAFSSGGFRGNRVQIPAGDVAKVKAKIRAAWKKVNPGKGDDDMPAHIKEALESSGLHEDFIPLEEGAVRSDGTLLAKLIGPGWGTSGYYSEKLLREKANAFPSGTFMFWDHPKAGDNPERSLRDLAAVTLSEGRFLETGPKGPGVYADVQAFSPYRQSIEELSPHIGLSLEGWGKGVPGEAEGKQGILVESIDVVDSVDFVTKPGADGQVVQLFEAARPEEIPIDETTPNAVADDIEWGSLTLREVKRNRPDLVEELRSEIKEAVYGERKTLEEVKRVTDEEIQQLQDDKQSLEERAKELEEEGARLAERLILREAKDYVVATLEQADLPPITRQRLSETLSRDPVVKEGKLDEEAYKQKIEEAVKAEVEYITKLTGGDGSIRGMGPTEGSRVNLEEAEKDTKKAFLSMGLSEAAASEAVKGR